MSFTFIVTYRNKDELTDERLAGARIFVLAGSREKFSQAEVRQSSQWLGTDSIKGQELTRAMTRNSFKNASDSMEASRVVTASLRLLMSVKRGWG